MMRATFAWKLFASYVALVVLTAVAVGVLHQQQVETDTRQDTLERLRGAGTMLAELARPALRAGHIDAALQARLQQLGRATATRYTVITEGGMVLADSDEDPHAMENHRDRPEIRQARESDRIGTAQRFSATLGREMLYVVVPVAEDGQRLGYARASHTTADLSAHTAALRRNIALGAALAAVVGCIVAFWLARGLTARLRRATAAAQAIAAGDHRRRIGPIGHDEVARLAGAVDAMAHDLGNRLETITKERKEVLAILKSMVEGVVAVDREQRVVLINDEARRILHVPTSQVTGRPIWEVTRMQAVCEIIDLVIRGAREARDEIALPQRGGDRCLELHSTPLRDEDDQVAGAVVVLHDITGLRRLEKVRRDFVANVSHELKTPLTAIRGFVETLLDDDDDTEPDTRRRFLGKIRDHTHRLSALVADLLTLSRVESQGIRPEQHPLDLREPARASAHLLQARAEEKGLEMSIELPDEPVRVVGDGEALRQVVDNLLDNAVKYTPTGGHVWLRIRCRNGIAELEVEDTGVGLEPQHQERIFERFYRVDQARSRELGGTGLGLSIVKHVVLAHQGQVSVQSEPGAGSKFRVLLPVATPAANGTPDDPTLDQDLASRGRPGSPRDDGSEPGST